MNWIRRVQCWHIWFDRHHFPILVNRLSRKHYIKTLHHHGPYTDRNFDTPPLRRLLISESKCLLFGVWLQDIRSLTPLFGILFRRNPNVVSPSRHHRLSHLTPKRVSDSKMSSKNIFHGTESWHPLHMTPIERCLTPLSKFKTPLQHYATPCKKT